MSDESPEGPAVTLRFHPQISLKSFPPGDGMVLPIRADQRPLRGVVGLADWRLRGMLSRLLMSGRFSGRFGETCLVPGGGLLPVDKLLLFGVGSEGDRDPQRIAWAMAEVVAAFSGLEVARQLWPMADLAGVGMEPHMVAELWLEALSASPPADHALVVGGGPWAIALKEHLATRAVDRSWRVTLT